jgi:hypothetical protein
MSPCLPALSNLLRVFGFRYMRIMHPRVQDGSMSRRHPPMEQVIDNFHHGEPAYKSGTDTQQQAAAEYTLHSWSSSPLRSLGPA